MNKKIIVDILMFLSFLIVVLSGFVLWLILPRGAKNNFIFSRGQWFPIHIWTSVTFIFFILVHLLLNHSLIKEYFQEIENKKKPKILVPSKKNKNISNERHKP